MFDFDDDYDSFLFEPIVKNEENEAERLIARAVKNTATSVSVWEAYDIELSEDEKMKEDSLNEVKVFEEDANVHTINVILESLEI